VTVLEVSSPIRRLGIAASAAAWHPMLHARTFDAVATETARGDRCSLPAERTKPVEPLEAAVLVVDDDLDECRNMSDILIDQGYRVDTACASETALRLAAQRTYYLALLDLKMPGMDGLMLSRELTRLHPAITALLLTGYPEDLQPGQAQRAGVRKVFRKPADVPRLLVAIEEHLLRRPESGPTMY
jgi:CheY-like chemotaxis protein